MPETAAASGTVASTTTWPSRSVSLRFVSVSDWLRNGTQSTTTSAAAAASALAAGVNVAAGHELARPGGGLLGAAGVARAEDDGHAGAAPADREAESEGATGADDRDWLGQAGDHSDALLVARVTP